MQHRYGVGHKTTTEDLSKEGEHNMGLARRLGAMKENTAQSGDKNGKNKGTWIGDHDCCDFVGGEIKPRRSWPSDSYKYFEVDTLVRMELNPDRGYFEAVSQGLVEGGLSSQNIFRKCTGQLNEQQENILTTDGLAKQKRQEE